MVRKSVLGSVFVAVLCGFIPLSFAQGVQTSGGVDIDGSWYLGEGLSKGDYFEYSMCEIDLNDCAPIKLKMWIKGNLQHETETLWDAKVVVYDGDKIIKGSMGLGETPPQPITFDDDLFDYSIAFKSSLGWLGAFATGNDGDRIHGPQEFRSAAWGKIAAVGGAQLIPKRAETISISEGIVDTVVVGWYSGNNNEIWIVDDFPFPVKASAYAWVTTGTAPIMYQYTLLDFKENVSGDPFKDVKSTLSDPKKIGCTTEFHEYESGRISTNTHSMMLQYNYSPKIPMEGCDIDWKINFMNKYHEIQFEDEIHYDIWVVDENDNKLRSYAQDLGREELFNGFGQVHIRFPVEEKSGLVRYAIFVHGTGPEYQVPDAKMSGYAIIEIDVMKNSLLEKSQNSILTSEIPTWIKNNAGWWADGSIDDDSFVLGMEFLIKEEIIEIYETTVNENGSGIIPTWIKNNAGWWADGSIDDDSFVLGMEFLIKEGMLKI